jgi:hypothetical protein
MGNASVMSQIVSNSSGKWLTSSRILDILGDKDLSSKSDNNCYRAPCNKFKEGIIEALEQDILSLTDIQTIKQLAHILNEMSSKDRDADIIAVLADLCLHTDSYETTAFLFSHFFQYARTVGSVPSIIHAGE